MHSPRHTPEHISLLLFDAQQSNEPFALFTGDTLFNLAAGTPICLARPASENWSASCSTPSSIVSDRTDIYPCHGAGSACGKSIGDRRHSTLGNKRLFNPALRELISCPGDHQCGVCPPDLTANVRHYCEQVEHSPQGRANVSLGSTPACRDKQLFTTSESNRRIRSEDAGQHQTTEYHQSGASQTAEALPLWYYFFGQHIHR